MPEPDNLRDNRGIIAREVTVVTSVIGDNGHAQTTNYYGSSKNSIEAAADLHRAIEALNLPQFQRELLENDLKSLQAAVQTAPHDVQNGSSYLRAIVDKLRMTGSVIKDVAELVGPLTTLAGLLKVPLHLLGL